MSSINTAYTAPCRTLKSNSEIEWNAIRVCAALNAVSMAAAAGKVDFEHDDF